MAIMLLDNKKTPLEVTYLGFSGGERHVQLGEFGEQDFIIRAFLRNTNDVFDLLLLTNALNARFEAPKIYLEIPYLPYARQDRVCAPGQAFSLDIMAGLIKNLPNVKNVVIWDCHSPVGTELTGAQNIEPQDIIKTCSELVKEIVNLNSVLICPDKGAIKRTEAIAQSFEKDFQKLPIVYCEKLRDPANGQILKTNVQIDDLTGITAIITDDICDGGYTFIKVAEELKAKGADRVILYVTHGIFAKGLTVFDDLIDQIFTTSSFQQCDDPRLTVIPFAFPF